MPTGSVQILPVIDLKINLGATKLPVRKMEEVLNRYGAEGWDLSFMVIERHRFLLFWAREAAVITFSKPLG